GVWHNKTEIHDGLRGFGVGGRAGIWLPHGFEAERFLDVTFPTQSVTTGRYTELMIGGAALYNYVFTSGPSVYARAGYGRIIPRNSCQIDGVQCGAFGAAMAGIGFRVPIGDVAQFRADGEYRGRSLYDYSGLGAAIGVTFITGKASGGGAVNLDQDS